jgi:predicted RNA-binding Zn ribbon-like protein
MRDGHTAWTQEHFIGGHPALDLCNTVFSRRAPTPDNELMKSAVDVANWLRASGLADRRQAAAVAEVADEMLVEPVRGVREASFSILDAIAADEPPPADALGLLCAHAAAGLGDESTGLIGTRARLTPAQWRRPDAITALLALLAIEAFFGLPRERLRSCPRCGWLFVDSSRGSRRRWCSMRTCGNREKSSRHREAETAG